ncbi:MAG: sulfur transferase domain-containing protein [Halieaceae bacterium]|nr:sulfur transferase domain-containing protein [Halieaceae bacterium]
MRLINLSDKVSVSGQINLDDVSEIVELGFDVLINNRPDFEVVGQPINSENAEEAVRCGLRYYYYPVISLNFPGDVLQHTNVLFNDSTVKTLAFCRSGTRSANLWLASQDHEASLVAAQEVSRLGIDPSMFLNMLRHSARG